MKRKSGILASILAGVVFATCLTFTGCGKKNNTEDPTMSSISEVYGFAGATTSMLLGSISSNSSTTQGTTVSSTEDENNLKTQLEDTISETLDQYMSLFNSVIGGNKPVNVSNVTSDKSGYKHKMTITTQVVGGESNNYTFYFNETLAGDSSQEVDDTDSDENETELKGVMYVNDDTSTTFYMTGKKELEQDEIEIELTASLEENNPQNYVVFKQEKEIENGEVEEEYVFKVYANGIQTKYLEFELERDANGKIEVEYEHEIGGSKIAFEIEKSGNNIKIETANFLGIKLEITVTATAGTGENEGKVQYTYSVAASAGIEAFSKTGKWQ